MTFSSIASLASWAGIFLDSSVIHRLSIIWVDGFPSFDKWLLSRYLGGEIELCLECVELFYGEIALPHDPESLAADSRRAGARRFLFPSGISSSGTPASSSWDYTSSMLGGVLNLLSSFCDAAYEEFSWIYAATLSFCSSLSASRSRCDKGFFCSKSVES